jgi:dTDP-4-dehydrorhamnose 3,5-epimerase
MTLQIKNNITGVIIKELKQHADDRGFFSEIIRYNEPIFSEGVFAQWSHSRMQKDVVKAWHYHHQQTDWWYVASGLVQVVLIDNRSECPSYKERIQFLAGEKALGSSPISVKIPPGVLHGLKVLSDKADLFYITSKTYDPNDEGRIPFNAPEIGYNWGSDVITVERDRKAFTPTYKREEER